MSELITMDSAIFSAVQKAELDVQVTTAKTFKRDVIQAHKDAVQMATLTKEIAESCIYSLPRKDADGNQKFITGPSVRISEIILSCWGNMHVAARISLNDGKKVVAEAVAWDLEKNNKFGAQCSRSILSRSGRTYSQDMQSVTENAAMAIASRNAIFKIVPRSLVDSVLLSAQKAAIGTGELISSRVDKAIVYFSKLGISEENLLKSVGVESKKDFTEEDMITLTGLKNALKEGAITVDSILGNENNDESRAIGKSTAAALLESIKNKTLTEE